MLKLIIFSVLGSYQRLNSWPEKCFPPILGQVCILRARQTLKKLAQAVKNCRWSLRASAVCPEEERTTCRGDRWGHLIYLLSPPPDVTRVRSLMIPSTVEDRAAGCMLHEWKNSPAAKVKWGVVLVPRVPSVSCRATVERCAYEFGWEDRLVDLSRNTVYLSLHVRYTPTTGIAVEQRHKTVLKHLPNTTNLEYIIYKLIFK